MLTPKRIVILPSGMIKFEYENGIVEIWKPGQPGYEAAKERARAWN